MFVCMEIVKKSKGKREKEKEREKRRRGGIYKGFGTAPPWLST
jgi:hypothetical protein